MKKRILFTLLTTFMLTSFAAKDDIKLNPKAYPEFSWDTVPVALHFFKRAEFSDEELKFIAKFPLFCIEKHQGVFTHKDSRKGAAAATAALKKINPKIKTLFYWNSNIDGGTNYIGMPFLSDKFHPEWKLSSSDGSKDVLVRGHQETFDSTIPEFRKWWADTAVEAMNDGNMDGIFIDALPHYFKDEKKSNKLLGKDKAKAISDGVHTMCEDLARKTTNNKILVFNNVNPAASREFEEELSKFSDGGMIENFCNFYLKGPTKESALAQINQLVVAGKQKRIMMVKGWPRYSYRRNEEWAGTSAEEMKANMDKDIVFPLSCFLMGAGEYAYFLYSYGYGDKFGSLMEWAEFKKPLGKPLGDYKKEGWKLSRKFQYADAWVNLETREAEINWKKK